MLTTLICSCGHKLTLVQLQQEQAQMQETLRKAEDIRWAKEGEVTILRQGMQKVCP